MKKLQFKIQQKSFTYKKIIIPKQKFNCSHHNLNK